MRSFPNKPRHDPDIHLFGDADIPIESVDLVVSAFQTASDVVLQKSVREGFGLTVTEAMWNGKPVIGGNVGGIRLQISDGENGFLVDDVPQCAQRILRLLEEPELQTTMGEAARTSVRRRFLLPRLLRDYLRACEEASWPAGPTARRPLTSAARRPSFHSRRLSLLGERPASSPSAQTGRSTLSILVSTLLMQFVDPF